MYPCGTLQFVPGTSTGCSTIFAQKGIPKMEQLSARLLFNGWHPAADLRGDLRHSPRMALYRPSLGGCVWMPDGSSELSGFQKRRRLKHTAS